jgi:hypothetical protein
MKLPLLTLPSWFSRLGTLWDDLEIEFHSKFNRLGDRIWQDILISTAFAVGGGFAAYWGQTLIDPALLTLEGAGAWFDADVAQVFERMTDRLSDQRRTSVHPLFPLVTHLPVILFRQTLGLSDLEAVRGVMAIVAALWLAAFFVFLRLVGCRRLDSAMFTAVAATSSTAIFWFIVPETHSFSSLSLMVGLCLFAVSQRRRLSPIWYSVMSALTLSLTVTDWWVGLILAKADHPWPKAWRITCNAFLGVTLLWGIQRAIFPFSEYFLALGSEGERVGSPLSIGPKAAFRSFFTHSIVMPKFEAIDGHPVKFWQWMITQPAKPGSASVWGMLAVGLWLALLGLAVWALFSLKQQRKIQLVLGLSIVGQLILYLLYGWETFLYAPHFAPLLIGLTALSSLTRQRVLALLLAGLLIPTAGINNLLVFQQARDFYAVQGTQRHLVQAQMLRRPADPWARGVGHVVLAEPGSPAAHKAYHEPGGSFSPTVGSFGVSLWVVDAQGNLKTTSDAIPLDQIEQQWRYTSDAGAAPANSAAPAALAVPQLQTRTPHYQATWAKTATAGQSAWQLTVTPTADKTQPIPVIRSVGAAGAPITSLQWQGQTLRINDRWTVTLSPAPAKLYLGSEQSPTWKTEHSPLTQWQGADGWGYARFEPADNRPWTLTIQAVGTPAPIADRTTADRATADRTTLIAAAVPGLKLDLPDRQFVESLTAQVSQIAMGLVGNQTRPSEPINSPVPWQRSGAYQLVSLVRAGKLDLARQLSIDLAERDFLGGMGPEADAPGLSIWALTEVADALHDRQYDQWLWTHIQRKAALILEMLSATAEIRQPILMPIVPALLTPYGAGRELPYRQISTVAKPAVNGLIVGRVGLEFPVLFVNAVSYRGLIDAANLAERVGQPQIAQQWRDRAAQLQQAWTKAFESEPSDAEPDSIRNLWHTWIAEGAIDPLTTALQDQWQQTRDAQGGFKQSPTHTDLSLAEAHQWLYLNQPQRVWQTLHWFWQHQASPGLYTWWDGKGEVNTYNQWQQVRGWVMPPHVTPHYGAAAEMLLLQLDMLAYRDRAVDRPTIVIGAGIPAEWLAQPMRVDGIWVGGDRVDWQWNGKMLQVRIEQGESGELQKTKPVIRLGSAFAPDTLLKVNYF